MSIILANFGKYAIFDCPFMFIVYHATLNKSYPIFNVNQGANNL